MIFNDSHFAVPYLVKLFIFFFMGDIFLLRFIVRFIARHRTLLKLKWKFRTRKPPLISALVKVLKITFCLYYCATARGRLISMFCEREKFIVLIRQAGKNRYARFACAGRSGLTSSFNEISGKRCVTVIGADNRKGIHRTELSILLCVFLLSLFYDYK